MDVLLVPSCERRDDAVEALHEAAEVYGWRAESAAASDGAVRVRVVSGTCSRKPEPRRVLERARLGDASLVAHVRVERMPLAEASRR